MTRIVHIGMAKAASTSLQRVFSRISETRGLAYFGPETFEDGKNAILMDADVTDDIPEDAIVSHEGLSVLSTISGAPVAERIGSVLGKDSRVLIILREQRSWLKSRYVQDLRAHMGGNRPWLGFEAWLRGDFHQLPVGAEAGHRARSLYAPWQRTRYDEFLAQYEAVFSPSNLLVLPMESIHKDAQDFMSRIFAFLGFEEEEGCLETFQERANSRISRRRVRLIRLFSKVMSIERARGEAGLMDRRLRFLPSKRFEPTEPIPDDLLAVIRDGNRRLAKRGYFEPAAYGYLC